MRKHLENTKLAAIGCGVLGCVIWVDQRGKTEILGVFFNCSWSHYLEQNKCSIL